MEVDQEVAQAIKELDRLICIGDLAYYLRDRIDYTDYQGKSWDHPTITKFTEVCGVLRKHGLIR